MLQVVVDTNILSALFAGDENVAEKLDEYTELLVPFVVVGELFAGYRLGSMYAKNQARLRSFLDNSNVVVLHSDEHTPYVYAELFAYLRTHGTPIPINDVWIAALTVQSGTPLYTRDSDFKNLPQLRLV